MTGYVANPLSGEMLQTLRDELAEFQIDEIFSTAVFLSRLKLSGPTCLVLTVVAYVIKPVNTSSSVTLFIVVVLTLFFDDVSPMMRLRKI
jgi:hypothetical protein